MKPQRQQLGDIATIFVGIPTKQSQLKDYGPSGNVLTVRALGDFGIDNDQLVRVDLSRDVNKYRAHADDLVLSARSTSLKLAIVPAELDGVVLNATLVGVRSLPVLDPRLLAAYFNHPEGLAALESVAQSATLQMNLTVSALSKIEVPVPPLEVQHRMLGILAAADTAYQTAIDAAKKRRLLANEIVVAQLEGAT